MVELGARRNEFSLASKILHWITPARVPVYDILYAANSGTFSNI
jgi:hypothetical protein